MNIRVPVKYDYDSQMILDADNKHICDIRGWGWIQYNDDPEDLQDKMGEFIAEAINEKVLRGIK